MKKNFIILLLLLGFHFLTNGQKFAIGADKNNILYIGIDNPLTIAAENLSSKSIIVRASNGSIDGENGRFSFRGDKVGPTVITLYKLLNKKLIKIGSNYFRVKRIPPPIFKIGPGEDTISKAVLQAQLYVRADLEGDLGFDLRCPVDSFTVCIFSIDPCGYVEKYNVGNKISEEIINKFKTLKQNDIVIFKDILCIMPDGKVKLDSRMLTVTQ